jgi:phage terminase large subunit
MKTQYGRDHDVYRIRVLGEFPRGEQNSICDLGRIEEAVTRFQDNTIPWRNLTAEAPMWGLDVARFGGDRSTLAKRIGHIMPEPVQFRAGHDLMEVAGWVMDEYKNTPIGERPFAIMVDSVGYGAGVIDRLKEQGLPVRAVNGSSSAKNKKKYFRLRDELWYKAAEWFRQDHVMMCDDGALIKELSAVGYTYQSGGKLKAEDKDKLKERGQRSPDLADAFVLTFAYEVPNKSLTMHQFANYDYDALNL